MRPLRESEGREVNTPRETKEALDILARQAWLRLADTDENVELCFRAFVADMTVQQDFSPRHAEADERLRKRLRRVLAALRGEP